MPEVTAVSVVDILAVGQVSSITVNGTGVAYSNSFPLPRDASFAFEFLFSSPGSVNVKVELEQGNSRPATEGAADDNFVIPASKASAPIFSAITVETVKIDSYAPVATRFGRLKLTGISGNDAATALTRAKMMFVH